MCIRDSPDGGFTVVKSSAAGEGQISAVTGATVSSNAVTAAVNEAVSLYQAIQGLSLIHIFAFVRYRGTPCRGIGEHASNPAPHQSRRKALRAQLAALRTADSIRDAAPDTAPGHRGVHFQSCAGPKPANGARARRGVPFRP